ncbi:L-type lectin-domain containing receptor kinase IX.1 [Vitis vinifera]|uniref:L-type lectin-domain containing receptor kinase IX.1 n=1 Tax=Vitis vinifera TaxID=29760 RepID=A0A438I798_VITVI|nr:L-type lectin-domain containing receptor kinase IX.1 [Vitis vinifera]
MFLSYASSSKNLSVIFCTDELYVNTTPQSLYYKVNLSNYLPEFITSGFLSATGDLYEINVIYSWNFSSSDLQISDSAEENQGKKTGLVVVGLSVGVCALVAEAEKLGEGGFGGVYKGFLRNPSSYIVVKRVSRGFEQGIKEYASEVKIISRLRPQNLMQLKAGRTLLIWAMRYKIATGLASAMVYLHEEWEQYSVHKDVKSSNVMLDANFNSKLGDFGLSRLVDHGKVSQTTVLAGLWDENGDENKGKQRERLEEKC